MKTGIAVSEHEYLTNPAYEHYEYVGGEVVEKPMGTTKHGRLQVRFCVLLNAFAESRGMDLVTELHCLLTVGGETVYRLPDVSLIEEAKIDTKDHLVGGPTLAIEIRSPEDRTKALLHKAEEYFANGTKLVWIVDPEAKNVMVLVADRVPWIIELGEELTGSPVWPELKVDLEAAFRGI